MQWTAIVLKASKKKCFYFPNSKLGFTLGNSVMRLTSKYVYFEVTNGPFSVY